MTTDEITTNQHKEIFMKKKSRLLLLVSFIFMVCLSGCAKWQSVINDLHGSLMGNSYSIYTYDNYGSQTLKTSGNKISITGNKRIRSVLPETRSKPQALTVREKRSPAMICLRSSPSPLMEKRSKAAGIPASLSRKDWNRKSTFPWKRSAAMEEEALHPLPVY